MKRIVASALLALAPTALWAWPWSTDMMNQPSVKPQELPPGKTEMMPYPLHSMPTGVVLTDVANRDEAKPLKSPVAVNDETLKEGRTLFRIICAACHGKTGNAESPVAAKIGAIKLTDEYVQKELTEGWVYGTITFGSALMPAYGSPPDRDDRRGSNDLTVEERWMVVNYVKHGLMQDQASTTAQK